jgi:hypothetical protein
MQNGSIGINGSVSWRTGSYNSEANDKIPMYQTKLQNKQKCEGINLQRVKPLSLICYNIYPAADSLPWQAINDDNIPVPGQKTGPLLRT